MFGYPISLSADRQADKYSEIGYLNKNGDDFPEFGEKNSRRLEEKQGFRENNPNQSYPSACLFWCILMSQETRR